MRFMRGSNKKVCDDKQNNDKEVSIPLLAFTFFYSISIFTILLSFYFWQWNKDINAAKDSFSDERENRKCRNIEKRS